MLLKVMKQVSKTILRLLFIICFHCAFAGAVSESTIWQAVDSQVKSLRAENKFKEAVVALNTFMKQFPASIYKSEALLAKGDILAGDMNRIEEGFFLIEKAENIKGGSSVKVDMVKNKYAEVITRRRLNKIRYFLDKYFTENISFPSTLTKLSRENKELIYALVDGFGSPMFYRLSDDPLFKGEDKLKYELFSGGKDQKPGTEDDIFADERKVLEGDDFKITSVSMVDGVYVAEISWPDKRRKLKKSKSVKEGDLIKDYSVFGINKNGVVLLKGDKPLVIMKE